MLQAEGIYRLSGQVSHVRTLKESFFDEAIPRINLMTVGDVHEVCACLIAIEIMFAFSFSDLLADNSD